MRNVKRAQRALLAQQSGQIQFLIIAPILTLSFLSLVVRSASSAVDTDFEKRKITQQLKRRLSEVQNSEVTTVHPAQTVWETIETQTKETPSLAPPITVAAIAPVALPDAPPVPNNAPLAPVPLKAVYHVWKEDTLAKIFKDEEVAPDESNIWLKAAKKLKEFRTLQPRSKITLSFSEENDDRSLQSLSYEKDERSLFVLERTPDGNIKYRRETFAPQLVWRAIGGRIEKSLYKSAIRAGVPARIIDELADMDWDIELSALRSGDTFKVIFEELQKRGKPIECKRLLAAEIFSKGKTFTLFPTPSKERRGTNVSQESGIEVEGYQFLRYPLQFTRITSVFTDSRLHPVLGYVRPHTGVDFAAPYGTPIRAVADGKITFCGRQAGYGNYIRIDHPGPYDSAYAHLKSFAGGIEEGVEIERGQVIGYVGSTGLATGPHLHFELSKDGEFINPLSDRPSLSIAKNRSKGKQNPLLVEMNRRLAAQLAALRVERKSASAVMISPKEGLTGSGRSAKPQEPERVVLTTIPRDLSGGPVLSDAVATPVVHGKASARRAPAVKKARNKKGPVVAASRRSAAARSARH